MEIAPREIAYAPSTGVRRIHETPLLAATAASLAGYGCLVDDPRTFPIEIVRWPAQGWRPIDANSGDQGGVVEGLFEFCWKGETLYARNNAVGDSYLFGWSNWPEEAAASTSGRVRERALIWRANYHPDGGQLFYPLNGQGFVVPLALPGDDVTPDRFVTFFCDGRCGLICIRTSGTERSCRSTMRRSFWTARVASTRASRSTSSRSSAATWVLRYGARGADALAPCQDHAPIDDCVPQHALVAAIEIAMQRIEVERDDVAQT
jgi:hypothetical protein